ncbi:Retrovirus-related Pol polyprotein from transposon TNT 1-94 [Gossypium australe]|uniref:Retrovirus-related Pol polyprotein from transposon TNT 1-94 n=1 Tax=Gossypium australe TaxID=47621 RepID=A0A5B6WVV8_9ROSI|nr:Retrovirus-related Pol polyprotein from transposon TNT 1-94 [Gossypium australe]
MDKIVHGTSLGGKVSHRLEFFQSGGSVLHIESFEQKDNDPFTYDEVMQNADSKLWEITMKELVDLLEGIKPIGCKWIYKKKRNEDGKVETYKARLLAKRKKVLITKKSSLRLSCSSKSTYYYPLWWLSIMRSDKWMSRQHY